MSDTCLQHIEEAWKLKTNASNKKFNDGNYEESLQGYEEALCRAEVLNNHLKEVVKAGIPFMQIFAISCNNIAFTYEKIGLVDKGEKMLKRVVYYLIHISKAATLDAKEVQNELTRAILNYTKYASRNDMQIGNAKKVFKDIKEEFFPLKPLETNI